MNDFIFNVIPAQGPIIPQWIPIISGMPASTFAGSFLGVILAFAINWIWQTWNNKRIIFEEEFYIKAELSGIAHDQRVGGRPEPIRPIYGADHVRKYRLFGEYRTQVIYWYEGFQKHNVKFENFHDNYHEILRSQESIANQIEIGQLGHHFMKIIPGDINNSGLSRAKFVWYLLGQDALGEPTKEGDFKKAFIDKLKKMVRQHADTSS